MGCYMEMIHFKQARVWLESAIKTIEGSEDEAKYSVGVAMLVHSIIKSNDALTLKFLNETAKRHDDARRLFEELINKNLIKSEYSSYKTIVQEAINIKSKAEYRGSYISKNDFESLRKKAEKFIKMTEVYIL